MGWSLTRHAQFRTEFSRTSIRSLRRVHYDGMAVELRVKFSAGVMHEARNDPVTCRLDCGLTCLLDPGFRYRGLKVLERLGHRQVMRFDDSAILGNQCKQ